MELTKKECELLSLALFHELEKLQNSEKHQDVYKQVEKLLNKVDCEIAKKLNI